MRTRRLHFKCRFRYSELHHSIWSDASHVVHLLRFVQSLFECRKKKSQIHLHAFWMNAECRQCLLVTWTEYRWFGTSGHWEHEQHFSWRLLINKVVRKCVFRVSFRVIYAGAGNELIINCRPAKLSLCIYDRLLCIRCRRARFFPFLSFSFHWWISIRARGCCVQFTMPANRMSISRLATRWMQSAFVLFRAHGQRQR